MRGVEALPLRYIIFAIAAAIVVGIVLQFIGALKGPILGTGEKMGEKLETKAACALDEEKPEIEANITIDGKTFYFSTLKQKTYNSTEVDKDISVNISALVFDRGGCGIDKLKGVWINLYNPAEEKSIYSSSMNWVRDKSVYIEEYKESYEAHIFQLSFNQSLSPGTYTLYLNAQDRKESPNSAYIVLELKVE